MLVMAATADSTTAPTPGRARPYRPRHGPGAAPAWCGRTVAVISSRAAAVSRPGSRPGFRVRRDRMRWRSPPSRCRTRPVTPTMALRRTSRPARRRGAPAGRTGQGRRRDPVIDVAGQRAQGLGQGPTTHRPPPRSRWTARARWRHGPRRPARPRASAAAPSARSRACDARQHFARGARTCARCWLHPDQHAGFDQQDHGVTSTRRCRRRGTPRRAAIGDQQVVHGHDRRRRGDHRQSLDDQHGQGRNRPCACRSARRGWTTPPPAARSRPSEKRRRPSAPSAWMPAIFQTIVAADATPTPARPRASRPRHSELRPGRSPAPRSQTPSTTRRAKRRC